MKVGEVLLVETRRAWHSWLVKYHNRKKEVWLVNYKKASGKHSLSYDKTLDEALCFGWIDGQIKSIDNEYFVSRWSPRRPRSNWSAINRARALRLLEEGRMTEAGIAVLPPELQNRAHYPIKSGRTTEAP